MFKDIAISIIVPVFNAEPYIKQCLSSIKGQKLDRIEVLVYDDCSTDRSLEICQDFASKDLRFKVFSNEKQQGQAYSLNKGIATAKGEYIGTVDADDWVDSDFYFKLYTQAKDSGADIVKGLIKLQLPNGSTILNLDTNKYISNGLQNKKPIYQLFNSEVTTGIYKRRLLIENEIKFPAIPNALDIIFLLYAGIHANSLVLSDSIYNYRIVNNSISRSYSHKYFESILKCFKMHIDFCNTHQLKGDDYDFIFFKGLIGAARRFEVLEKSKDLKEYKEYYTRFILDTIKEYNGNKSHLLEFLYKGMVRQQRMTKIISWLPFKLLRRN